MGTRDDMCGMDVGKMEDLGGFAEEITILGCAYKEKGEVLYRVTDSPEEAYEFYARATREGLLPTLSQTYVRREIIPAGQRARMTDEAKLACARQMQQDFDARFWQLFDALSESTTSNAAYELLERHRQALEGRYSREPLDLFAVFLGEALQRRRVTPENFARFDAWVNENYERMADDWVVKEKYERTFYGFAYYKDPTSLNLRVDTAPFNLLEKQQQMRQQGFAATPIFKKTVQYKESSAVPKIRREFQDWLKETVQRLALPFEEALAQGEAQAAPFTAADLDGLSEKARETLTYYARLWGLKE